MRNAKGNTPFDIALKKNHTEIIEVFLSLHEWPKLIGLAENQGQKSENLQFKLLNKSHPEMTTIILDKLAPNNERKEYNYAPLDPSFKSLGKTNDHPLSIISKTEKEYLLKHEVIRSLIKLKWRKIPRWLYYTNLITYALFLFLLTYHLLTAHKIREPEQLSNEANNSNLSISETTAEMDLNATEDSILSESFYAIKKVKFSSNGSIFLLTLNIVLLGLHLLKELFQFYHSRCRYFYALDNNLELFTYILSIIFLFPPSTQLSTFYKNQNFDGSGEVLRIKSDFQWGIGSLCGLSGWIVFAL